MAIGTTGGKVNPNIYIGIVESLDDKYNRELIKARIISVDGTTPTSELPYAAPLLPKMLHIKPKVGEGVLIIAGHSNNAKKDRFYIGPLISQAQFMYYDDGIHSVAGLPSTPFTPVSALTTDGNAYGTFPNDDDIAVLGRHDTDIILGNQDIEIRCGAHLSSESDPTKIKFNRKNPAFIKLQYYNTPLEVALDGKTKKVDNAVNVIGQYINILSTDGDNGLTIDGGSEEGTNKEKPEDSNKMISPEMVKKMIETAHPLPYGDELCKFLSMFFKAFLSHTHNYNNVPTVPDMNIEELLENYTAVEKGLKNKLLSKHVRIN